MKIKELIKVLEDAKTMAKAGHGEDEVLFANDEEGNELFSKALLQPTRIDEDKTVFVFYPVTNSNIDF